MSIQIDSNFQILKKITEWDSILANNMKKGRSGLHYCILQSSGPSI